MFSFSRINLDSSKHMTNVFVRKATLVSPVKEVLDGLKLCSRLGPQLLQSPNSASSNTNEPRGEND